MEIQDPAAFRVGDWRVLPAEGVVIRGDDRIRLEPKAMEVLVYLASRPGEVVSRGDLEQEVWRGCLVGYDAVTSTVIKLRKALGDQARQPRFILTVPKRGYQLIAPVTHPEQEAQSVAPRAGADEPDAGRKPAGWSSRTRTAVLVGLAMAAAGIAFALFSVMSPMPPTSPSSATEPELGAPPSIIVLPFENLSDDPKQEHFADGITEDIITDLSGIADLLVVASNTSFTYKGRSVPPRKVGADLHVDFVLDGSIRRHGDSVRVNAQLVDAKTGFQKWAKRYDRRVADVFAVQDEVTNSIVAALAINLTNQERQRLAKRTTDNLEAYDYFQEGQRLSRVSTKETNLRAQEAYWKAIASDPAYGRAYGALAYAVAFNYRRGWTDSPAEAMDRALELAQKAVALDSTIPQTYWALGFVHLMRQEYDAAESAVHEALRVAPNYADGYGLLALIKNALGDAEPAIELIRKGMQLNPFYTWDYPYNLGRAYYTLGRNEEAIELLEEARARNENAVPIRLHLAASYARAGRIDDAEWEVQEIQTLSPTETVAQFRNTHPVKDPDLMRMLVEDLRKAGLPE